MRKIYLFLVSCFLSFAAIAADYNAVIVADMDTGRVLYSENANDANYPASLTKIMTLYLTFDALEHKRLDLDDQLIVSAAAAAASPVKLGLSAGSKIKVEDAIKALTVHSANDVALVLAENLKGGKEGNFASLMTQVATEIGLGKTNFENSSGLPDDDHLSSARDIALLSMAVYKHFPQYWKYFGIKSWTYNGQTYANGNRLLGTYPGADGMKTGFTNKSKYSLVATAARDGRHIMAVVLGAQSKDIRASVATKMLDKGFYTPSLAEGVGGAGNASRGAGLIKTNQQNNNAALINEPAPRVAQNSANATPFQPSRDASADTAAREGVGVSSGGSGIQFGAFSSRTAAESQIAKVKKITGLGATIETAPNGMFRVRTNGLAESAAQSACASAKSNGLDCYVY
jgi:D-alanyl-D-alanine carboxypeptidase